MDLFTKHQEFLKNSINAIYNRGYYAAYPEHIKAYDENADNEGREAYKSTLGNKFDELNVTSENWVGSEISPYTLKPLGVSYPQLSNNEIIENSQTAFKQWRKVSLKDKAGILIESLERFKNRFFEVAYATMHTTGQGYMMAFQASGPHAADRAMEAVAMGFEEVARFPKSATWEKPMGKFNVVMQKSWLPVPKGIGLVIGCSTFPTWNSVPGIYANLITGNTVIVKPHPGAILPIAIVVSEIRKVLKEQGYDPNVCQLAPDTHDAPITKLLAEDSRIKLIDYTGNSDFGSYLEKLPGKLVFTEKTGVNSVILDSVENIDKVAANLAFSLSLYSGQMCTAPQNFFVPEAGIKTSEGTVSVSEFSNKLAEQVKLLAENPKAGPFVLGAIQNPNTSDRIKSIENLDGNVLLRSTSIENPMFSTARTSSPIIMGIKSTDNAIYNKELFGPVALIITTKDTDESIALAKELAEQYGAISCGAYTIDPAMKEKITDEMTSVFAPVSFNLDGAVYLNQHAAFSDFHVTGGNPAGNASFVNPEYIIRRFTWVGIRE